MKSSFELIGEGLWQWREWFISQAYGRYWLLTPVPREFGPFQRFEHALQQVDELVF